MTGNLSQEQNVSDIFNKYRAQLKNYISKRVLSKEDGEDILQSVFYRLAKVDLAENPIEQVSSWLYSVAHNLIVDRSRKHKELEMPYTTNEDDESVFLEEFTDILWDDDSSPEMEYMRALVWEELDAALAELPAEQREVFELTEMEGISFKEISEVTGVAVNTLISRKRYAVLHLRERLKDVYMELLDK